MSENSYCYSYTRFSTPDQLKGHSLERQLEKSRKYAADNNLTLVEELQDLGISGWKGQGSDSALGRFKAAVAAGNIKSGSYLLIEEFDRLSRQSPMIANTQFFELLQAGIKIVTLNDLQIFTLESVTKEPMQLLTALIKSITAHEQSEKLSKRLKELNAKRRSTLETTKIKGKIPSWLTLENNVFIENDLVKAIKKIYEMSIAGYGSYAIAKYLNEHIEEFPNEEIKGGRPKKNNIKEWTQSYVSKILYYKSVTGEYQPYHLVNNKRVPIGEPIKNYYPVIISLEDFNISQLKMQNRCNNSGGPIGLKLSNIFTKLVKCSCDSTVVYKDSGYEDYLICINRNKKVGGIKCESHSWIYLDFENFIFKNLKELDINSIFLDDKAAEKKSNIQKQLDLLSLELDDKSTSYNNLITMFEKVPAELLDDLIKRSGIVKLEISKIESKIKTLNDELISFKIYSNNSTITKQLEVYANLTKDITDTEIRDIRLKIQQELYNFVDKIVLYNNHKFEINDSIEDISSQLEQELIRKRYDTENSAEKYLLTSAGQKLFNKYNRYVKIHFKNGAVRSIFSNGMNIKPESQLLKLKTRKSASKIDLF
jgi:hypothetical protein